MTDKPISKFRSLYTFVRENGLFLAFRKIYRTIIHRSRDFFLARRLGISSLQIGDNPKLSGLKHIHLGENFSAGSGLWIDAITYFANTVYDPAIDIGPNCNLSD